MWIITKGAEVGPIPKTAKSEENWFFWKTKILFINSTIQYFIKLTNTTTYNLMGLNVILDMVRVNGVKLGVNFDFDFLDVCKIFEYLYLCQLIWGFNTI